MTLGMVNRPGQLPNYGFPVLANSQVEQDDAAAVYEPGMIIVVKNVSNWGLAEYIQLDNNGCSQGETLVTNFATLAQYSVAKASTDDAWSRAFRGFAAATIASQAFGWMYIGGYVEKVSVTNTVASGDFLQISGSTAGGVTGLQASPHVIGISRTANAGTIGSVTIIGVWG